MDKPTLFEQRQNAQEWLDKSIAALQAYSRIKGVRRSDIARASLPAAMWKKRLDELDAQIKKEADHA